MSTKHCMIAFCATMCLSVVGAFELDKSVMSDAYWKIWNDEEQAKIDAKIEKNRKADASFKLDGVPAGTEVTAQQISHKFVFGAHIFNFNQLGTKERNQKYKELYGTLFNSATLAFYWRTLEPYQGTPRFVETYWDSEEFWNNCKDPKHQPHWRRPATDPVVAFCKQRGIRMHGHPLAWGNIEWMLPTWIWDEFCPDTEKFALEQASGVKIPTGNWKLPMGTKDFQNGWTKAWAQVFKKLSPDEVAALTPTFFAKLNEFTESRIAEIAKRYGTRIDSWDVVNESAADFRGKSITGKPFQVSHRYGITAGDLAWRAFSVCQKYLPKTAQLNINDYDMNQNYMDQIEDLKKCGAKIDIVGSQMHLFNPKGSADIAKGKVPWHLKPEGVHARFDGMLSKAGRPIHLSEITITAPDLTEKGQMIQAIIVHNMYRAWFSQKDMMGITWWNVVDDCGAPGEPSISGLFTRDMKPKLAYHAMNHLINKEWKTSVKVKTDADGKIAFRGFRGKYRLTWNGADGKPVTKLVELN